MLLTESVQAAKRKKVEIHSIHRALHVSESHALSLGKILKLKYIFFLSTTHFGKNKNEN